MSNKIVNTGKQIIKNIMPYGMVKKLQHSQLPDMPVIEQPDIYNKEGEMMKVYYLCDSSFAFYPYCSTAGRTSKYILWDRANYGLKAHFYTHWDMFRTVGQPQRKYALQLEGESSMPELYQKIVNDPQIMSEYEYVFTHNDRLLDVLPNAKPIIYGGVWYGTEAGGGEFDPQVYMRKTKNVSILASNKQFSPIHKLRYELAMKYKYDSRVDCYGYFDGGPAAKCAESLTDYRYSIIIECEMSHYFITEKVLNCFASMTVPIYIGTNGISEFFNMDGIIRLDVDEIDKLDSIIDNCCKEDYQERLSAILDNYERVQGYLSFEDWFYNKYKDILK